MRRFYLFREKKKVAAGVWFSPASVVVQSGAGISIHAAMQSAMSGVQADELRWVDRSESRVPAEVKDEWLETVMQVPERFRFKIDRLPK